MQLYVTSLVENDSCRVGIWQSLADSYKTMHFLKVFSIIVHRIVKPSKVSLQLEQWKARKTMGKS